MGRTILVIGANGALGSAIVRMLLDQGDRVAATVSRAHKLEAFKQEFPGCDAAIPLDLSEPVGVKAALSKMVQGLPRLDAVVTCAALAPLKPLELTPLELAEQTFAVNAVTALAIYQATIDALRASKGRLIFTSSINGLVSTPMQGVYSASKHALEALADTMRQECSAWGVNVAVLEPGGFATPTVGLVTRDLEKSMSEASEKEEALYGRFYKQVHHFMTSALADPNFMQPAAVAGVAVEAVNADRPETRYRIGESAEFLINAKKEKSDLEMDEILLNMFRGAD